MKHLVIWKFKDESEKEWKLAKNEEEIKKEIEILKNIPDNFPEIKLNWDYDFLPITVDKSLIQQIADSF